MVFVSVKVPKIVDKFEYIAKQMITTIGPLYTEEKVAGVNNPDKKQAVRYIFCH